MNRTKSASECQRAHDTIDNMKILGIDPGIGRTGWGVVQYDKGKLTAIDFGCLETPAHTPMHERLLTLKNELMKLHVTHNPEMMAVEDIFFNTNAKTALIVGQARG